MNIRLENKDAVILSLSNVGLARKAYIAIGELKLNILFVGIAASISSKMSRSDRFYIKDWNMTFSEKYGIGYVVRDIILY